jgi:hypothetical protein
LGYSTIDALLLNLSPLSGSARKKKKEKKKKDGLEPFRLVSFSCIMDELTDAQREALKTLPMSYLSRLRAVVSQKRELDEAWRAEEDRVNRLREVIQDWKAKHDKAYEDAVSVMKQRLDSSEAGVSQAAAHGDKTKQLQLASLDEQLLRRRSEIEKIETQIADRQAKIDEAKEAISDLHVIMEKKRSLVETMSHGFTPRGAGRTVTRRPAMTLYKNDASTHRPTAISIVSPRESSTPRSARDMVIEEMDKDQPKNTPETAEPISKVDIDTVPARVLLESLLEIILEPSGFFVSSLNVQVRPNEQEKLGRCWVEIFSSHGELMDMLRQTVSREVEATLDIGTLFRSNSMASRMMSAFSRSIGMDYIKSLLKPKIDAIMASKENLEIDTMKIAGDQIEAQSRDTMVVSATVIDSNVTKLTEYAIDFIQTIMNGKARAPLEYYQISSMLKDLVRQKFPNQWKISIGGYLFLRLMCPCIFLPPDDFGYNFETVSPEAKRTLVLVSKILQNLANLQPKFVEEVMAPFSSFVTFNMHSVEQYFEYMANVPTNLQPTPLPEFNIRARLRDVLALSSSNQARLSPVLTGANPTATEEFIQLWTFNKAPKLLHLFNKLTLMAISLPYQEDSPDVIAFIDLAVPKGEQIAPIMKLTSRESVVAALPLDQLTHPPEEAHVLLAILETSTRLDFSGVENSELASSLFPIWGYRGRAPDLIAYSLDVFLRSPTKSNRPLLESVAAKVFSQWTRHFIAHLVKTTLSPAVATLVSKKDSLIQRETLLDVAGIFINAILGCLTELPESLFHVCHRMSTSSRFGIPVVLEFFLSLIWVQALEDPEAFGISTPGASGDRVVRKGLLMVADTISLVATGSRDKQNAAVDTFLTTSTAKATEAITAWLRFGNPKKVVEPSPPWSEISTSLDNLRIFIGKNMSSISAILEVSTSESRYVKFTIAEAITQMVKHAAAKAAKDS